MAKYFVNRGGGRAPEGPFEEEQILKLIAAKKLISGDICKVGGLRFQKLASHPPFAEALRAAGVAVPQEEPKPRIAAPAKSANRGLLLGAVLAIFALAIGAVAIGGYVMFNNGATPIHSAVPADTELLVEARDLHSLLGQLAKVRAIDARGLPDAHTWDDATQAASDTFGLPKARAAELLLAATTFGVAARKLEAVPEAGVFCGFSNARAVNALLTEPRFKYQGLVAKSGRKYTLSAVPAPPAASLNNLRRTLLSLGVDGTSATLVWFETSKILFYGSPSLAEAVAHTLALDVPGLEQSTAFKSTQQDVPQSASFSGYFDSSKLQANDPRFSSWFGADAKTTGPIAGSLEILPAGVLTHLTAHAATSAAPTSAPPPTLDLSARLPNATLAFVQLTSSAASGAEREQRLLDRIAAVDPSAAASVRAQLEQLEQRWSLKIADIFAAFGGQSAAALVAAPDSSFPSLEPGKLAQGLAVEQVFAVRDEAALRASAQSVADQLGRVPGLFTIKNDANGHSLTLFDGSLAARVSFDSGFGVLAFGSPALVERAARAFSAHESALDALPEYQRARSAFPASSSLFGWADAGRITTLLQTNSTIAVQPWHYSYDLVHALQLTGPDRVTAAVALSSEHRGNGDIYRFDGLNLPILAALVALHGLAP